MTSQELKEEFNKRLLAGEGGYITNEDMELLTRLDIKFELVLVYSQMEAKAHEWKLRGLDVPQYVYDNIDTIKRTSLIITKMACALDAMKCEVAVYKRQNDYYINLLPKVNIPKDAIVEYKNGKLSYRKRLPTDVSLKDLVNKHNDNY